MKATLLLVLLPVAGAQADLIGVQYEGTVTEVGDGVISGGGRTFTYAVGDPIAGLLMIDPSLRRIASSTPTYTSYDSRYTGFVTGIFPVFGLPQEEFDPESGDGVFVAHNSGIDDFSVQDVFIQANEVIYFWIGARAPGILNDNDIHQSFELTAADVGEDGYLYGFINDVNQGWNTIKFTLSRLTVKPGRCFAHG
jgi:hypothetical protein